MVKSEDDIYKLLYNLAFLPKYPYTHMWINNLPNLHKMCHHGIQTWAMTTRTNKKKLAFSKSNSKVYSTFYYKESIAFQDCMILDRDR